ncbi:Cyclin-U1-1 [Bienertia sinuspersici]
MLGATEGEAFHEHESESEPKPEPTTPRVLLILGSILERLVERNDQLLEHSSSMNYYCCYYNSSPRLVSNMGELGTSVKVFNGVRAPNISIAKYLERLYKYNQCSPSCFVVGYVYIDRLVHRHPQLLVISLNVHRLLLTSNIANAFYAKVGGVSNSELNRLELELLFLLDFEVLVSSPVFRAIVVWIMRLARSNKHQNHEDSRS